MSSKLIMPKLAISVFCLALLSACGGDDGPSMFDDGNGKIGFLGGKKDKTDNGSGDKGGDDKGGDGKDNLGDIREVQPIEIDTPVISDFLTEKMAGSGQQLNPSVTAMVNGNEIKFDQPTLLTEICPLNKCKSTSAITLLAKNQKLQKDPAKLEDGETNIIYVVDVNNDLRTLRQDQTIDGKYNPFPNPLHQDAGATKVNFEKINGSLKPFNGNVGKEFNKVVLIGEVIEDERDLRNGPPILTIDNRYLSAYFRSPAATGWSYQTFGLLFNENTSNDWKVNRDVKVGFQSVGNVTSMTEMPNKGEATYRGISHAYYGDKQVTMKNEIKANFGDRNLSYKTTEAAYLHEFDAKKGHIVEKRPDLNLEGSAHWDENSNSFVGNIHSSQLQGRMEGKFYGPNAQEIGGVFGLNGKVNGKDIQYVGGFGGTRAIHGSKSSAE